MRYETDEGTRKTGARRSSLDALKKSLWQSLLTFMIVWQSWLQRDDSLALLTVCEKARLTRGGAAGADGSWVKGRDGGCWSGEQSPLICVSREKYKRIKSNGESSTEDCKQDPLAIPRGSVPGKNTTRQEHISEILQAVWEFLSGLMLKQLALNHLLEQTGAC